MIKEYERTKATGKPVPCQYEGFVSTDDKLPSICFTTIVCHPDPEQCEGEGARCCVVSSSASPIFCPPGVGVVPPSAMTLGVFDH